MSKIKTILERLEVSVEKEYLIESEVLHFAFETWENVDAVSHAWHVSHRDILRLAATKLFGAKIVYYDLRKIWQRLLSIDREKAMRFLGISKIIEYAKTSDEAIREIFNRFNLNLMPSLQLIPAY